jgi:type II secretory pathway pseudopilin PulG
MKLPGVKSLNRYTVTSLCRNTNASTAKRAFTLIELILLMALLVIAVSLVTPRLANFFRGRTIDSETQQFLSLVHEGQSRAVSAGVPMLLWIDEKQGAYGLEEEPGYTDKDPDAVEFTLNTDLRIEIPNTGRTPILPTTSATAVNSPHASLPQIRFLPEGNMAESSPKTIRLLNRDGSIVSLKQSRDRNDYEIETSTN